MAELVARGACDGLGLPLEAGACRLVEGPVVPRHAVAPFVGRANAVAVALGGALPRGRAMTFGSGRILPLALGQWLVEGTLPEGIAAEAAVSAQSDAWAALSLSGSAVRAVLARLLPLDLDPAVFPEGSVARSLLRHVPVIVEARAAGVDLLVPRSFAATAVEEIDGAMRGVAGRAALTPEKQPL